MKSLLACALLVLVPFSSLRMVCLEAPDATSPARARVVAGTASAAGEPASECERICLRHPAAPAPRAAAATCVLMPNPQCAFVASPGIAVMPRAPVITAAHGARPFEPAAIREYLAPALARRSPPPRG